jgi:hypothetical protein
MKNVLLILILLVGISLCISSSYAQIQQKPSICPGDMKFDGIQSQPIGFYSKLMYLENQSLYSNSFFDITIICPKNWKIIDGKSNDVLVEFVSPLPNDSNSNRSALGIYQQDLSEIRPFLGLQTLDDYSKMMIDLVRNGSSERVQPISSYIGDSESYKIVYTIEGSKIYQSWTIKNDTAYMILYMSTPDEYEKNKTYMDKVLSSFTIN